jgi:riboflavin transporter FmnP
MNKKKTNKILSITSLGMMSALAIILGHVNIAFPMAPHLQFNLLYVPVLIGTFKFGRIFGTICLAITCILFELLFGKGFLIGPIMHFFSGFILVFTAGTYYHSGRSKNTALKGLAAGVILQTILMIPANYSAVQISPPFGIKGLIPSPPNSLTNFSILINSNFNDFIVALKNDKAFFYCFVIVPLFNFFQGFISSVMTFLIYKKISSFIKNETKIEENKEFESNHKKEVKQI